MLGHGVFHRPERITLGRYPDLTIEQARGKAASINSAIAHGENPADKRRQDRKEMTFGQLFAEYMQRHAKRNKRTWDEDEAIFNRHLSKLASLKLSAITRVQVASVHSHIGAEHPRTANKVLALVSSLFGRAAEWGLWDKSNPAKSIKKFKERSRDRFLQSDELPHFFQAVAEEPNGAIRDYVLLSLLTGARRSNVLAMRWEAISFGRGEWRIPETETKNGTPQVVTLSPEALAILANRKPAEATGHVFPGPGKPDTWKSRGRAGSAFWRVRVSKTCVSMTCAERWRSWQAKTGASLSIIGKSLNHKSPNTTAIYARLDLDPVRESVERAINAMLTAVT